MDNTALDTNFGNFFDEISTSTSEAAKSKPEENGFYLEAVQLVRVKNSKREVLDTIKVERGIDMSQRIAARAERFTKFGAVMVVEKYERVAYTLDHNPDYEVPVDRHIAHKGWIRRGRQPNT